jgi:hypothetical protein
LDADPLDRGDGDRRKEMNYLAAGVWWVVAIAILIVSFWFPYDWHKDFPSDGWLNPGIAFMFIFWCLTAIAIIKGFEWGIRLRKSHR